MTALPVTCILTSQSCGHCNHMRGTGEVSQNTCTQPTIPGGYCWNETFFKSLICGEGDIPKMRVYEVHFGPMNFKAEEMYNKIVEFNEFIWTGSKVQRNRYRSEYTASLDAKTPDNPEGALRVVSIIGDKPTTGTLAFIDFLKRNIQPNLYNYIRHYPSWLMCDASNWSRRDGKFVAHVLGFKTISLGGDNYTLEEYHTEKTDSVLLMMRRFLSGEIVVEEKVQAAPATQVVAQKGGDTTDEICLKRGYVKPRPMDAFIMMKTGDACHDLGYRIKSPIL